MPLEEGSTRDVVSRNISELRKTGRPHKQSVAIALASARKSKRGGRGGKRY